MDNDSSTIYDTIYLIDFSKTMISYSKEQRFQFFVIIQMPDFILLFSKIKYLLIYQIIDKWINLRCYLLFFMEKKRLKLVND
jgi:hypothetical protein